MLKFMRRVCRSEQGATAIEYSLIAGCIALALIAGAQAVGLNLIGIFQDVTAGFKQG